MDGWNGITTGSNNLLWILAECSLHHAGVDRAYSSAGVTLELGRGEAVIYAQYD